MRIALFSDIHGNLHAMEAVAASIRAGSFDAVFCLGDLGGYGAFPEEVQDLVEALGCPTVAGNYDVNVGEDGPDCGCHYTNPVEIALADRSFGWTREHTSPHHKARLRALPREIRCDADGRRVLLCHGSPRSITEYLFENRSEAFLRQFTARGIHDAQADVICFGHTHVPYHRIVDGVHFVNTGSVGRPKDGDPRAGYCVLEIEPDGIRAKQVRLEYDVEAACEALLARGLPRYFADYLHTGGRAPLPRDIASIDG